MSVHVEEGKRRRSLLRRIVDSHVLSVGLVVGGLATFIVAEKGYSPGKDRYGCVVDNSESRRKRQNLNFCAIGLLYAGILNAGRSVICRSE